MKRVIILLTVLVVALSCNTVSASAATTYFIVENAKPIEMELFWVNATSIDLGISFSGNTATCTGRIKGKSDVNSITATFTLKKNTNGTLTTVKIWSGLYSNSNSLNFSGTYSPVSKGETYRLEVTATLTTTSGDKETVSDYIDKKYS
jgi:hypothetical protein